MIQTVHGVLDDLHLGLGKVHHPGLPKEMFFKGCGVDEGVEKKISPFRVFACPHRVQVFGDIFFVFRIPFFGVVFKIRFSSIVFFVKGFFEAYFLSRELFQNGIKLQFFQHEVAQFNGGDLKYFEGLSQVGSESVDEPLILFQP
jgi:hypothetical protein